MGALAHSRAFAPRVCAVSIEPDNGARRALTLLPVNTDDMFNAITAHRLALADQLDVLTAQQWDAASLCEGWRVRDVLGHLVSILDLPTWKFLVGVFSLSGFNRRADTLARQYGDRHTAELLKLYRTLASKPMAPPGVGPIAPMADVITHTFDIAKPLGLPIIHAAEPARTVLTKMAGGFPGFVSKKRVAGLSFATTDLDWSFGRGPEVTGTVGDVLLALAGRKAGLAAVDGPGAAAFRDRPRA